MALGGMPQEGETARPLRIRKKSDLPGVVLAYWRNWLLHERDGSAWRLRVSAYQKLRLSPAWVSDALQARGFSVRVEPGLGGMVRVVAHR